MRGHSLIELLVVLALAGATAASLAPTVRGYLDRSAVVAAREALVGLLAETRSAAVETGQARAVLSATGCTARALARDSTLRRIDMAGEYGVRLELGSGRAEAELAFGPLGLGVLAGQTVRLRRGDAVAELIVSGYGRVRRR